MSIGSIEREGWGGNSIARNRIFGDPMASFSGGVDGWDGVDIGRQLRPLSDTLSAFTVMRRAFFGDGGSGCIGDGGTVV